MTFPPGSALAFCAGIGFIIGLVLDEITWGLIIGAAVGVLIDVYGLQRRR